MVSAVKWEDVAFLLHCTEMSSRLEETWSGSEKKCFSLTAQVVCGGGLNVQSNDCPAEQGLILKLTVTGLLLGFAVAQGAEEAICPYSGCCSWSPGCPACVWRVQPSCTRRGLWGRSIWYMPLFHPDVIVWSVQGAKLPPNFNPASVWDSLTPSIRTVAKDNILCLGLYSWGNLIL